MEGYERVVIDTIEQYTPVTLASIELDGDRFHLTLIVTPKTPVEDARRLGDNLVRLTKMYAEPEQAPKRFIGPGHYDYDIHVYLGPEHRLFEGRKTREGDRIRWIIDQPD